MKILTALNAFKEAPKGQGVIEINEGVTKTLRQAGHEAESFPIADGGDGTIDAFTHHAKAKGGQEQSCNVKGPLGKQVDNARWLHLANDKTAIIEMAQASGLSLIAVEDRDPLKTTSYGTGELVKAALEKKPDSILLTVGGSATVDGGMGMLRALGAKFLDQSGQELTSGGEDLEKVRSINIKAVKELLGKTQLVFLCDVQTPFIAREANGHDVLLYGPQKFSTPDNPPEKAMTTLRRGVKNFAKVVDMIGAPGESTPSNSSSTGAAGGIAYIPKAQLGATTEAGFDRMAKMFGLEEKVKAADVIITGEGKLDDSTFEGKAPHELIKLAQKHNKKVVFICGGAQERPEKPWSQRGIDMVIELLNPAQRAIPQRLADSIANTLTNIQKAVSENLGKIGELIK